MRWWLIPWCVLTPVVSGQGASPDLAAFERALDSLALASGLPGYSAIIVRDGAVQWRHAHGYADLARRRPATPSTPYRLASLTKPIAATMLMQLVERDSLALDAPMRDFAVHPWFEPGGGSWAHYPSRYADGRITVRHVLSHTSQAEPPGSAHAYNGNIFADLTWVLESITRRSFPRLLQERILDPLAMRGSAPGQLAPWSSGVVAALATPYAVDSVGTRPASLPGFGLEPDADAQGLDPAYRIPTATDAARRALLGAAYTPLHSAQAAAGMISTVEDLARFDIALEAGSLLSPASREAMFAPSRTAEGQLLPYGLGWFSERIKGERVVWHYGWFPPVISGLYLKLPDRRLTFILLSNSDRLSADMSWTARGVRASPFARLFLDRIAGVR